MVQNPTTPIQSLSPVATEYDDNPASYFGISGVQSIVNPVFPQSHMINIYQQPMAPDCPHIAKLDNISNILKRTCYICGNLGHFADSCTSSQRLCYNCKQPGHKSSECPNPKSKSNKQCYLCHKIGHVQAECPDREKILQNQCQLNQVPEYQRQSQLNEQMMNQAQMVSTNLQSHSHQTYNSSIDNLIPNDFNYWGYYNSMYYQPAFPPTNTICYQPAFPQTNPIYYQPSPYIHLGYTQQSLPVHSFQSSFDS
ncbi:hypothetical protein DASC09_058090 [Saccharomycopsis crataegensis]|uniref:CCHC-type domain-containing protein n=1 Tax=Saccharomycopsis crataegensis TaxID=43959 RepID=A0AAV5QU49_9ASCO|nr:hypothetical protein DASC09_058090 [Saccharomycopsis crataegensis]